MTDPVIISVAITGSVLSGTRIGGPRRRTGKSALWG